MAKNFAFLASTLHTAAFVKLRRKLHAEGARAARRIWVAEIDAQELRRDAELESLKIVDRCLDEIDDSEWFFLLVGDSFGSRLAIKERRLSSSYTELELFYATIREKRIALLFPEGAHVRGDLVGLIETLRFGVGCDVVVGEEAVVEFVKRRLQARRSARGSRGAHVRRLSGALAIERHHDTRNRHLFQEIEFLNGGVVEVGATNCDLELVKLCIDDMQRQPRLDRRMSRAWLAIRELMGRHYSDTKDQETLRLWRQTLQAWSRLAAWKGLHAHLYLGHIAALGSMRHVVEKLGGSVEAPCEHGDNLSGAFASVYYSLSKISPKHMSPLFLARSLAYVGHGVEHASEEARSGLYAIRGSIEMRRKRYAEARRDYENVLRLAERLDLGDAKIGQAKVELAWAELFSGRPISARRHAEEGGRLLQSAGSRDGFLARALRKLAYIRLLTGAPRSAYRSALEAGHLIEDNRFEDQRGIATKVALAIEKRLSGTS